MSFRMSRHLPFPQSRAACPANALLQWSAPLVAPGIPVPAPLSPLVAETGGSFTSSIGCEPSLLYSLHPSIRRIQHRQRTRRLGSVLDLATPRQQPAVPPAADHHAHQHKL